MLVDEKTLLQKLAKVEELFRRAASPGERAAAEAALNRLQARLGSGDRDQEPEVELKFSLSDRWSMRLFIAIYRKHGVRPYRYARQRRTTIMARARPEEFKRLVWAKFCQLHGELERYFEDVSDQLITRAMGADGNDNTVDAQ
ncbi:hypothetical protein [Candidatus Synechococcus spongiarum]|uniref:DUF2786 domain-containing protein n=1 Tax=Candidatus Synechococcus spongiarum TaxID=431041 RepID=A0A165B2Z9_9SYNE|nr:hypothetical protein [Candidatus Synechococcus spongiarum]SAY39130.1 hypothetical protein FLM9_1188 [Candidatus Synechococcus spongiarum]